jgi:hypothetical protein
MRAFEIIASLSVLAGLGFIANGHVGPSLARGAECLSDGQIAGLVKHAAQFKVAGIGTCGATDE